VNGAPIRLVHDFPLADGDATCDATLRVRLPSNWASYFLGRDPESKSAGLFVATLNHLDMLVFHRTDFIGLRARLTELQDQSELLESFRAWGGEAQLDSHGRFVLPPAVRKVLSDPAGKEFKIVSTLPVCLVPIDRYEERMQRLKPGEPLHSLGASQFIEYVKSQDAGGR